MLYFYHRCEYSIQDFHKRAASVALTDKSLRSAMDEVQQGLVDASLGGDIYKKRIAVGNRGKSGTVRTIIAYKDPNDQIFCLFVFP